MAINKIINLIQQEIQDLVPTLEQFVQDTIQPSVEDCEKLQVQLNDLKDLIAVYKYNKQNKEISPSFNIHAKLSEQQVKEEKQELVAEEIKLAVKIEAEEKSVESIELPQTVTKEVEPTKPVVIPDSKPKELSVPKQALSIGLNDKFRFLNELFSHNNLEYNIALEQLNNLNNWNDTEIYLNSLKSLYGWKGESETTKHLYSIAKQRFI